MWLVAKLKYYGQILDEIKIIYNIGFIKSANKHVHFFLGINFNILFTNFETNMQ
jgi:hypothetical protein